MSTVSHLASLPNAPASTGLPANGLFVQEGPETWYRIDDVDGMDPFFMVLAGDSDLWAFVSSTGSLAAGRRDAEGSFLPYETVDKIHLRNAHTGPRTWLRILDGSSPTLWRPFQDHPAQGSANGGRSIWKNLSGTRIRLQETHASGRLVFSFEWFTAASFGLVRTVQLQAPLGPMRVQVLDGILNLNPPGVSVELSRSLSSLADAYKWNESAADGRLGLFTLYAQVWDRAEPKESFHALTAWHSGAPAGTKTLLSARQVNAFCQTGQVQAETLTRGRRSAFLLQFDAAVDVQGLQWHTVIDAPVSQVAAFELAQRLSAGGGRPAEVRAARDANSAGLDELLARADAFQTSGDTMAAAHHRANVLFNIMRGGVFVDGPYFDRDDLLQFVQQRNRRLGADLKAALQQLAPRLHRRDALALAQRLSNPQLERLVMEYLPLTFSRRHGDPSRPWNQFSLRVRDAQGRRVVNYQGNWRDIFQNWEGLLPSEPEYAGSMIAAFVSAMTPDGYNPYRIGRDGIDWEVVDPVDPWSHIGYWGDHQVIYLQKLLEAAQDRDPALLSSLWNRALFSFADVPYRLKPYAEQMATPKETLRFDHPAHATAMARAERVGADGLLVCDENDQPVLGTLGEKLAVIVLVKTASLVPGGGLWLHTQRPEWNDANNALVGNGLSVVSLAQLRRMLAFLVTLPAAQQPFALPAATLSALQQLQTLAQNTPLSCVDNDLARRTFQDQCGALIDTWRIQAYRGAAGRQAASAPAGTLSTLARTLLHLIDATLRRCLRSDGLYESYNLVDFTGGRARVSHLYPMLEGQVAMLSSGLLSLPQTVDLLQRLFNSPLFTPQHQSFLLYPDRQLPGFLERNRLDAEALALPVVRALLQAGRTDILQTQSDGTVRFAPQLSNRRDLEVAAADLGDELPLLATTYERVLQHHQFTGRSGTMFGYEGLGCIYWHMVAKLLLAVQERVFDALDCNAPELQDLCDYYRRVRNGLGYRRSPAAYGSFPCDAYSHTPGEGGAQQPGMTGQVKEEILTRWGELGLRVRQGLVHVQPVLLDAIEIPAGSELRFTWARVPYTYKRGSGAQLRVRSSEGWTVCPDHRFDPQGVLEVEAQLVLQLPSATTA